MDLRKEGKQGSAADGKNTSGTKQYIAEFNYEFLDDYQDRRLPKSHAAKNSNKYSVDASTIDEGGKIKGFAAKWGPKGFSRWDHPLALMVSWFE